MKNVLALAAVVTLTGLSQVAASAPEKAMPAKQAEAGAPPMAKPEPALEAALKPMLGTWKCDSKMMMPPEMGGEMATKSQVVVQADANGFAYTGRYEAKKTKTFPGMKAVFMFGYDAAQKKLVESGVDSMGGVVRGTSDGLQGDKIVWNEEGVMMGKPMKTRTTMTMKGKKEVAVQFESETEPGKWMTMGQDACKK